VPLLFDVALEASSSEGVRICLEIGRYQSVSLLTRTLIASFDDHRYRKLIFDDLSIVQMEDPIEIVSSPHSSFVNRALAVSTLSTMVQFASRCNLANQSLLTVDGAKLSSLRFVSIPLF